MLQSIEALAADDATKVIVLISKPPAAAVAKRVLDWTLAARKPVVARLLGVDPKTVEGDNLTEANTLEDAAYFAAALANAPTPNRRNRSRRGQGSVRSTNMSAVSIAAARFASRLRFF